MMNFLKGKKNINYLTLSFIIFILLIFLALSSGFFLFKIIKVKDLKLGESVFAAAGIDVDTLGFSDMTLSEFVEVFSNISSPNEQEILKTAPKQADKTILSKDLYENGLDENTMGLLLGGSEGLKFSLILSERGICSFSDMVAAFASGSEIEAVEKLCGEGSVSVKSVKLHNIGQEYFADVVLCINIENIRNKILQNFGYPVYEICGKLYTLNTFELNIDQGALSAQLRSSVVFNTEKEDSDKLVKALFLAYYISDTRDKYVIDIEKLAKEEIAAVTEALNNMGKLKFDIYNGDRKDIKQGEIILNIKPELKEDNR
jgi:hypothetical protein